MKLFRILLFITLCSIIVALSLCIDSKNKEIKLKINKEDYIPKEQYIDDVEFLESVILELRRECGN